MLAQINHIIKEPLIQFLLIGLLIFIIDKQFSVDEQDPKNIIIDDKKLGDLVTVFEEGQGRKPSKTEENNMIVQWTQNEILYREALALQLDQGDDMIRSRLVLKMRNILLNKVTPLKPTDKELSEWYAVYGENYAKPAKYTVEQFLIGSEDSLNKTAAIEQLAALQQSAKLPEKYQNILRTYHHRSEKNLADLFNPQDISHLIQLPKSSNDWQLIRSNNGWHAARIIERQAATQPELSDIKSQVIKDWMKYSKDMQLAKQTEKLAEKYQLHLRINDKAQASGTSDSVAGFQE